MKNKDKEEKKLEFENNNADQNAEEQMPEETVTAEQPSVEQSLEKSLADEKEKYLRLFAEFENYKKRTTKERIDLFRTANQEVISAMLPVLDDFDRAILEIRKISAEEELIRGVELIHEKFKSVLTSKGLEVIEINIGDSFNTDFADAITQIPAPTEELKGKIVDILEKGYRLGDKTIRFSKVVIGQ